MSQYQNHMFAFRSSTYHSAPISVLPPEILSEIFKAYAASDPELLNRVAADLCLVGKYWNTVAGVTPELWTKINLSFPFGHDRLVAAAKRVKASRIERIDVSIEFRDPKWDREEEPDKATGIAAINTVHGWVEDIMVC